ncbi:Phosphatase dcr2 [Ceratocystis pirilliformis]|uniref:Phosphatase dcr2 n=1 Tax=Ceratocystis pirilliformis TaxID=259994 RepID=A0ABR3YJP3_9PEZI
MARRLVRTAVQLTVACITALVTLTVLDRNFRVLPTSIHAYMPQHHHGLVVTDVTIATCSSVNVFSSCTLDPKKWHRIDKDLYLDKALVSKAYLHVRRVKEEELSTTDKVVVDLTVGRLNPSKDGVKWDSRPGGIWLRREPGLQVADSARAITGIDVLFGDDATEVRDGWEIAGTPMLLSTNRDTPSAHITLRRGPQMEPKKPALQINPNGRFKIVQLADLHLSTGVGACRDAVPDSYNGGKCEADPRTVDFVERILDEEKPDLVVLSGDQVNGDSTPDAQTTIFKYAHMLIKRKIPYVSIFGNHDDEDTMSRQAQMTIIESLPYSLSRAGPADIPGVGNYYVEVQGRGSSGHSALTLYMIDSHAYTPDGKNYPGYDWIKPAQVEWFRKTAQGLRSRHQQYTHLHMDLAFIHIPFPEYIVSDKSAIKGEWREYVTAPNYNSGFHDALVEQGVVMVSCGHDHVNDYCALSSDDHHKPRLWMCYGGGVGFGGYAGYGGYNRRIRIFDVDTNEGRITTYKRLENGDNTAVRIDEQIIVDAGAATAAPMPEGEVGAPMQAMSASQKVVHLGSSEKQLP